MAKTGNSFQKSKYVMPGMIKGIVFLFFAAAVVWPLINVFLYIDQESIMKVRSSPQFFTALKNSLTVGVLATVITLVVAYLLAICVERSGMKHTEVWSTILILPMLIPSISHGTGLIVLFGNNGFFTKVFGLSSSIYGLAGIVAGSVMYAFPVAFLMFRDILKYEDRSPYEAAEVLGISKFRQFTAITLPYLLKPLISVTFAVFTMVVTDYGVPLMIGGKYSTIPVIMYQEVIGQLDFGRGSVYGVILLVPAVIAFLFDLLKKEKGNSNFVTGSFEGRRSRTLLAVSYVYCGIAAICVLLPIAAFAVMGFANYYPSDLSFSLKNMVKALDMGLMEYFLNSIVIALCASALGVVISFVTAYFTARMKSVSSKLLHLVAITSAAVPGIVLGLSYVLVFKGSFIYGTMAILVMVNMIHFVASPYIMMYNCLNKLNQNLEPVGETLGISRFRVIRDVIIPQCRLTFCEMVSYFFVNCMITISAVSFLANAFNKPAALMINEFEAQMRLECAAIVSLVILAANLLFKLIFALLKKKINGSHSNNIQIEG